MGPAGQQVPIFGERRRFSSSPSTLARLAVAAAVAVAVGWVPCSVLAQTAVPFAECPTGSSFPLSSANTAYTSAATGWGRKADLINEQGNSYVFRGWEPGFPNAVSVSVSWGSPVTASHILIARDPQAPTAGTIRLTAAGVTYSVGMSGQGGWISVALPSGTALQSFTIRRNNALSNVMEVALCVPSGSSGGDDGGTSSSDGGGGGVTPVVTTGVPFAECPTGLSFPLSSANTAYTSAATGWGRKADLINEQGNSYVFRGWEPGFPNAVSVSVSWGSPVTASHILIARDPQAPTAGTIRLTAAGVTYSVGMSGQGGWISVALPSGTALQSFTIRRNNALSNVMEVALCVPSGSSGGDDGGTSSSDGASSSSSSPACSPVLEDSYGDAPPPADTNRGLPAWQAVDRYYSTDAPVNVGSLCPQAVHDTYWVRGEDGMVYPTWHPATGSVGGVPCAFGHEHGEDPRTSDLYCLSRGVPFGLVHTADPGPRQEDHVGHKVTARNGFEMVLGVPFTRNAPLTPTGVVCSWLSKLHQGTHSNDALGENAHEYYLAYVARLAVLREHAIFGPPSTVTSDCNGPQQQSTGVAAPSGVFLSDYGDGKREFRCAKDALFSSSSDPLFELWKTRDRFQTVLGGGSYTYSPYYMVMNPARYYIDSWQSLPGLTGPAVKTVDLCYPDTPAYEAVTGPAGNGAIPDICAGLPADLAAVAVQDRWRSPLSPFVGDHRGVHPKKVQLYNENGPSEVLADSPNSNSATVFCTDAFGNSPSPVAGGCAAQGRLTQIVGALNNGWTNRGPGEQSIDGTTVGAVVVEGGGLVGPGPGLEWTKLPQPGSGVVVPN
ncbi:hypothetical protein MMPV_001315 [Pyropia vietnamensis]